jgi:Rieske Fe-S protein
MAIATREQTHASTSQPQPQPRDPAPSSLGAYSSVCPHMGGPLQLGEIAHGEVTCPWHRFRFDLKTGQGRGMARLLGLCLAREHADTRP